MTASSFRIWFHGLRSSEDLVVWARRRSWGRMPTFVVEFNLPGAGGPKVEVAGALEDAEMVAEVFEHVAAACRYAATLPTGTGPARVPQTTPMPTPDELDPRWAGP